MSASSSHDRVPDDWFVGFQVGLKAKFWRAASEPWADADAAAIHRLLDLPAGARMLEGAGFLGASHLVAIATATQDLARP